MTLINAFLFFLIALVYSSAGFGGGSMYLAVLSQTGIGDAAVRMGGLACNAVVTTTGTINFHLKKWIVWPEVLKLLAFSTPACIASSLLTFDATTYFIVLGCCLLPAGLITVLGHGKMVKNEDIIIHTKWWLYPISLAIGFISGITGIGGGVYLSPILHLTKWGSAKHIAATSSVYILVNSVAGIIVQFTKNGQPDLSSVLWFMLAVLAGGLIGSRLSSSLFSQKTVRILTGVIIIFASVKILARYL
ncbi:MAG: sulfite exporter TauE/SafE family protein [Flavobacteriales bacterium]|nr:sulfite exporter TauE/SafE family protein [Flavobacteriales bacterium]